MQRALIQYRNPENYELVCEALRRTHREDLIGFGPKCLVRPRKMAGEAGKPSRGKGSNGKGFGQKTANDRSGQGKAKTGGRPKKTLRNVHKNKHAEDERGSYRRSGNDRRMKIRKGDYGYIRREKKKRLLVTLGLFVLPAIVFIVGLVLADGNKSNILRLSP